MSYGCPLVRVTLAACIHHVYRQKTYLLESDWPLKVTIRRPIPTSYCPQCWLTDRILATVSLMKDGYHF
ncbi:hypothetical protein PISMIDRAFT_530670 [Pisolithus microcarpus 441]|uniref:Uncharacterized protein n=1 Tax=Pisolithus microcarpus 441 TaxID=765257 RepID=A0A0C9XFR9_9AGAM|nr:hypothetical protein PISMIDRAFT_530670 [Pisolithus microcarpus 441]